MAPTAEACRAEIESLHGFFADWFSGRLPQEEARYERLRDVLDPGFLLVSPEGARRERAELLEQLYPLHGSRPDGFEIWIEDFELRRAQGEQALVTYQEWQEDGGYRKGRISSAWFRAAPDAPHGVVWLHVHETALPE